MRNPPEAGGDVTTSIAFSWPAPTVDQIADINTLVDQLVFSEGEATDRPVLSPGVADGSQAYRERFQTCQEAFRKLSGFKGAAFPILVQHLDDKRQSINFRNHVLANSVGYACYLIIYDQLQDRPRDYSEYGWSRKGRDGQEHPKPYWVGTPFDDAGGLTRWLSANRDLTYTRMQIKCLAWLLAKEQEIGACDPESYFVNILPLEIRILERRQEAGDNVADELQERRRVLGERDASGIPRGLLPER